MITVIDYGMGNLRSMAKALSFCGAEALISSRPEDIRKAGKLVLPGVGAFSLGMRNLNELGLVPLLKQAVAEGKPFLGVCLGMQLLFSGSEEGSSCAGIGLFEGRVKRFEGGLKVPHMGWNTVESAGGNALFEKIPDGSYFYFVHSYYAVPEDPRIVSGYTRYGIRFASALNRNNVFATQFHPEKSQADGLKLLAAFCGL